MSFVGLHIHSDYSLLDDASQIPQPIDRALELDTKSDRLNRSWGNVWCDRVRNQVDV